MGYNGSLSFYRTIKEGNITLEKAEEQHQEFKLELHKEV